MSFKRGIVVDYVPSYGGNRQHKEKTVIGIRPMNNDGAIDFMSSFDKKFVDCGDEKEKAQVSKEVAKQSFVDHVAYVKNYQVEDEKDGIVDITTGEALYTHASKALINEITIAVENSSRLSEGQAKNFSGDSAGSE